MEPTNETPATNESTLADLHQQATDRRAARFTTLAASEYVARFGTEDEWLIPTLFEKGSITCFHGKGSSAKSVVAILVSYFLALSMVFPGTSVSAPPQKILYIAQDGSAKQCAKLIRKLHVGMGLPYPENFRIFNTTKERVNLSKPDQAKELKQWICEQGFNVVVIDALSAVHRSKENESEMDLPMSWLIEVVEGRSVAVVHHAPKSDPQSIRGNTIIRERLDNVWNADLKGSPGASQASLVLECTRSRTHVPTGTKLFYTLEWDERSMKFTHSEVTACDMIAAPEEVLPPGNHQLDAAVEALVTHLSSGITIPEIARSLRTNFPDNMNDEAIRKVIERSLKRLKKAGKVEQHRSRGPWYPFAGGFTPTTNGGNPNA
jgi:hypothetical protein